MDTKTTEPAPTVHDARIRSALEVVAKANAELAETVRTVQAVCLHEVVVGCPEKGNLGQIRVCVLCGLSEVGSYTKHVLVGSMSEKYGVRIGIPAVSRDDVYAIRQGFVVDPSIHVRLENGESLTDLILGDE